MDDPLRIALTGAGGFVGSTLLELLTKAGTRVRAHLGAPGDPVHLPAFPADTATFDITDRNRVDELVDGVDVVVHAAGPASVARSFAEPERYHRIHVDGTATVVASMGKLGVRRLVYVSSAEVYGRPLSEFVEETHGLHPLSPYGAAKAEAEAVVHEGAGRNELVGYVLRPFSLYGPRQADASLLGSLLQQSRAGDVLLVNDFAPVRDYCFVYDLAVAVFAACSSETPAMQTLNIGTGVGVSVQQVAETVARVSGRAFRIVERPGANRPADVEIYRLVADTRRAAIVLRWAASHSLEAGLIAMRENVSVA